jgi:hypothetical protein
MKIGILKSSFDQIFPYQTIMTSFKFDAIWQLIQLEIKLTLNKEVKWITRI